MNEFAIPWKFSERVSSSYVRLVTDNPILSIQSDLTDLGIFIIAPFTPNSSFHFNGLFP
jgi:hypothetical protein